MRTEEITDIEARIIDAAKQVFVQKGYEATKMGDIAAEVGISRTALHYYYRTKEMLFDAVFGQLLRVLLPNIAVIMEEKSTFLQKLPKIVEQYVQLIQQNPSFPIFVINEFNRDPERLYRTLLKDPSRMQPMLQLRMQLLAEMEQGLVKKMPLLYTASTLLSLVVFPVLARNPLTKVFLEGSKEQFDAFFEERKQFITDIMMRLMTPDKQPSNE